MDKLPSKAFRRNFLRERGWSRISSYGAESWQHARYPGYSFFTLAAAYRLEIGIYKTGTKVERT